MKDKHIEEKEQQQMGDVYDVYAKAAGVHSKISGMTEDYTLARYNIDIYNEKMPRFIREQRKLLRIIKSYIIIPKEQLMEFYNTEEQAEKIYKGLEKEYRLIEELLLGELDECVIMGRTPQGEVISAFLEHGLNRGMEDITQELREPTLKEKLTERR